MLTCGLLLSNFSFAIVIFLQFFNNYIIILSLFIADTVSTIIVYIFGLILNTASIYDPYWSVAPILIGIYALIHYQNYTPINIIYLVILSIWGIRLTINWMIVCSGFDYEDWRYRSYREALSKPLFHIVNFIGLQMIPTLVVYAALSPMFVLFQQVNNYLALIGIGIMMLGILLEIFADREMHAFLNETKEKIGKKHTHIKHDMRR